MRTGFIWLKTGSSGLSPSVVYWLACLTKDPSFAGSNPDENDGFLRATKIRSTTSFGGEIQPSGPIS
jgi:hypothetical protein